MKYEITISKSDGKSEAIIYYLDIDKDQLMVDILMAICEAENEYIRRCK